MTDEKLSEHLTLAEMCHSQTAIDHFLPNIPTEEIIQNMKRFAAEIFEPVRALVGKPVHVTSGFRSDPVELLVSGTLNSQHRTGHAADIHVDGMPFDKLFELIRVQKNVPYDQLIVEGGCVHISGGVDAPRRMAMVQHSIGGGKFSYEHIHEASNA